MLLNRGYDVLQLRPSRRFLWSQNNLVNQENVFRNVLNPFSAVGATGGAWKLTREELLPLSYTATTARWVPNYGLHLIGGGSTYTALKEWFDDHDAPVPAVWSIGTLYAAAFVNEALENNGVVGPNTDCLADLYVFDLGGILLFSIPGVNEFFSRTLIVSDWSLQPAFTQKGELHNEGNYYAVKFPVPFYERLRLFGYMGFASLGGLSYKVGSGYSISAGAGGKVGTFENTDTKAVANIVILQPSGALFLDRNESLLASLQVSDVSDYFVHLNVYPNAFVHLDPGFGFFGVLAKDGRWLAGISMTRALGFGFGGGTL